MMVTADRAKMKALFKEALVELIQERKELFTELLTDALEDVGLTRAIDEGRALDYVNRAEVMAILDQGDESPF